MVRVALVVHIILMTVLMGALVIAIVAVPSLAEQAKILIPFAALVGFVAAMPVSVVVARRILAATRGV